MVIVGLFMGHCDNCEGDVPQLDLNIEELFTASRAEPTGVPGGLLNGCNAPEVQAVAVLRAEQYPELHNQGNVYLDYTGGGLAARKQISDHLGFLQTAICGNTHSTSPASSCSTKWIEAARSEVLHFFNAAATDYDVIFTANPTAALKLVGEGYPFNKGTTFLLSEDNHNSVNGIQCFAQKKGATVKQAPLTVDGELRLDAVLLKRLLKQRRMFAKSARGLFAYPAQSNLTGVQHSLDWVSMAHEYGWDVLLDAAAFAPTSRLDLGVHTPDYMVLSFYKMFGYPTGIGCLVVRRAALAKLAQRPWYAGGTVDMVYPGAGKFDMLPEDSHGRFEEGTLNYMGVPAISIGLQHLESVGMGTINRRVAQLADWLINQLVLLHHPSGSPLVRIVGPANMESRGGNVAFIVLTPAGVFVPCDRVQHAADALNISLRTGCMCNPGTLNKKQAVWMIKQCNREAAGVVRVSFGIASDLADAQAVLRLVRCFEQAV